MLNLRLCFFTEQGLEALQKDLGTTMVLGDSSIQRSDVLDPRPRQVLSALSDPREVHEDRQKSYLVGASMQQTVDLATATVQHGAHSSVRSYSQSNTPMAFVPPHTAVKHEARSKCDKETVLSPLTSSSTADTSPAPGPASVAVSLRASANGSPLGGGQESGGGVTPQHPMGARACSDETGLSEQRYGADLYKEGSSSGSIIFAGPGSSAASQAGPDTGPDTITQDDMIVKADIGFSNKQSNGRVPGAQPSFWSAMTDNINLRSVPLLALGQLNDPGPHAERVCKLRPIICKRDLLTDA